ncbi:phosphoketolase family protein [Microlunatus soli]|uniref:Xylulose-5-phosphate/fructose-6-phosphate phosphoketolase n=1 Tax=Microlunatus soli TaxID=630515 RepID=A0A1H1N3Q6_9ACTN|nr:phosphoketolase family protein [Microlunatus soli]SDR93624.1 xylulose-5-phosphate/fructose-6-phosphate phosphoketolase [Microlunatus soli]
MPDTATEFRQMRRYRAAADYLAAAQIYLRDNVLLTEPLRPEHLKPRLLGHWGTCPGITMIYAGLNRLIRQQHVSIMLVTGPGHGAPAIHANLWLEESHAERDPVLARTGGGLAELVRRFSWPDGFPSHLSPEVPGVIHEGGELGYALATAFGAAADAPDRIVACIVGDGEAETGPTAAAWQLNSYADPATGGVVLPILHLNGYKIASPTRSALMSDSELTDLYRGYGWSPLIVDLSAIDYDEVDAEPDRLLATGLDAALARIREIQRRARGADDTADATPPWPMLILRTRKGWGLPASIDGTPLEGTFHAHQVPISDPQHDQDDLTALEQWLRSYRPDALFPDGEPCADVLAACPPADQRMGTDPATNGGVLRRELDLPELTPYAIEVPEPGAATAGATPVLGPWLADVMRRSNERRDFCIVSPDELESNRLEAVLEATDRLCQRQPPGYAEHLGPHGRVLEVLSEHNCQGWLQGYLLTGRHGVFPSYEAFVSIVDGMVNQYAKFLKMAAEVGWRAPVSALNYLLTSEGWRQEHNGYSHQGPGFINTMLTKKEWISRIYLPPDANSLLVIMDRCLRTTDKINVVVAGKQPAPQWMSLSAAREHCRAGAGVWNWASNDDGDEPDIVLACAGNIPTVETLAAASMLRRDAPGLRVRVVNIVDLLTLAPPDRHPHGAPSSDFVDWFGRRAPVVLDFHGYPSAVHECLHGRPDSDRFHVRGYREEGTTTTPYDLLISNGVSRHDLAIEALHRAPGWSSRAGELADRYATERERIRRDLRRTGVDPPEITDWTWA